MREVLWHLIVLPPVLARTTASASTSPPSTGVVRRTDHNRILLVEDDAGVRELLVDVLQAGGYFVHAAASAEDAQVVSEGASFDLLLTDLDLPGMNGARLAAVLTAHQPPLSVIVMSGYPDDGTIDAALSDRPLFLRKPFSSTVLLEQVARSLAVRQGRRTIETPAHAS